MESKVWRRGGNRSVQDRSKKAGEGTGEVGKRKVKERASSQGNGQSGRVRYLGQYPQGNRHNDKINEAYKTKRWEARKKPNGAEPFREDAVGLHGEAYQYC